jgi:dolichyl-phosphate beta-glucosyltransferase
MNISFVIPAYNEEKRLPQTLKRVCGYLRGKGLSFEIIVVDDGSRDATVRCAQTARDTYPEIKLLKNRQNSGKGFSVRRGVLAAAGELVLYTDSDLSAPIEDADRLLSAVKAGADIAIGSRGLPESRILTFQPWYRRLVGTIYPRLVRLLLGLRYHDTQCGFKLLRKGPARFLFQELKTTGFSFDVELLYRARKAGYRVKEVPVTWANSRESKVVLWRDPLLMVKELVLIRFKY